MNVLQYATKWREARGLLEQQKSILLIGPRRFGKVDLLDTFAKAQADSAQVSCLSLSSTHPTLEGKLDYGELWGACQRQLGERRKGKVVDRQSFERELEGALGRLPGRVIVLLRGAGRGNEDNHYELLATLHDVMVNRSSSRRDKLSVWATDDYSLFLYHKRSFMLMDRLCYQHVHLRFLSFDEISQCIQSVAPGSVSSDAGLAIASKIHMATGGHAGLVQELVDGLQLEEWRVGESGWDQFVQQTCATSNVLESLNRALAEDPEGYSKLALEYVDPKPGEAGARLAVLRQLGVVKQEMPPVIQLCPGAITRFVERLATRSGNGARPRLGTVVGEGGPRMVEEATGAPADDDVVIVHISDLHVGKQYKHRLTWPGGARNANESSAAELLRDDLKSLGLLGRVDGVIFSGDFVWDAAMEEFLRAKEVIEEMLTEICVHKDRALLIPGNHDVRWDPGEFASTPLQNRASRETFDAFLALLGKVPVAGADVLEIASRSRKVVLRIIGLDSNRVEGPEAAGIGFVSHQSLSEAKSMLEASDMRNESATRLTWIAVHHHIFPAASSGLAEAQRKKISVMANAAEILDYANQWKVEMILHGHEHQPSVTVARRWPVDVGDVFAPIAAVGAGSFGVVRDFLGHFSRNHYYIIQRRADDIIIRSRCQGDGGVRFIAHSDLCIPTRWKAEQFAAD
jgi:3',5'-cyclic AMP phosphodiesterase CpdA